MKKKLTLLCFMLTSVTSLIAQQKVTLTVSENPVALTPFFNDPASADKITTAPITLAFVFRNADLSKLTSINFLDGTQNSKVAISGSALQTLASTGSFNISTDGSQQITSLPGNLQVPFPFTVLITYNGQKLSSGQLGVLAPPPPQPAPTTSLSITNGTKNTGVAYYDALAMDNLIKTNQYAYLYDYMVKFYFPGSTIGNPGKLMTVTANNPFFQKAFANINGNGTGSANAAPTGFSFSSIGSTDVTSLADGLAQFLVKRSEQELTVAFFDKFQAFINNNPDAKILFPATLGTLKNISTQLYNYSAYLSSLRSSFEKDINSLPANLPTIINSGPYVNFFNAHGELKDASLSALYIGNALIQKEQPGKIIAGFNADQLITDKKNAALKAGVLALQLISESLRSIGTDHYWISSDSLKLLLSNPTALNLYLGIVYQQAASVSFKKYASANDSAGTVVTLQSLIAADARSVVSYEDYIQGFITQTEVVTNAINSVSSKAGSTPGFTDYYNFYNSSLDLIQYMQKAVALPGLSGLYNPADLDSYISIARAGGNLAFDIHQKSYGSAVMDAYTIYNYGLSKADIKSNSKTDLLKYATFIATVAEAKNGTDVESAIEAIVLPAGSASIKRNKDFNIALNAYIGPYFGAEKIHGFDQRYTQSAGLTASIGLSTSVGNAKFLGFIGKPGWSYSLFVSVIDIGALASYRLTNSAVPVAAGDTAKTAAIPAIQLKDIISPGAFLSIGIPKTPLSISGGFQLGPNLRTVTTGPDNVVSNTYAQKLYTRWSVSLVVDLPLLNLYTSPK